VLLGFDAKELLSQGRTDYLISLGLITKALSIHAERKEKEVEVTSRMIAYELAQVLAKIF
jgi:hypothetical protein